MTAQPDSPTPLNAGVPPHDALLAGLAVRATELASAAEDLRTTYRFSRWMKATLALGAVVLAANAVMLGVLINLATANHHNGDLILSCTTPQGSCYQDGATRTARAVGQIVSQINAHTDAVLIATLRCSGARVTDRRLAACLKAKGIG